MILGNPVAAAQGGPARNCITIEEVFQRLAQRQPDALALADAPNRQTFTDGAPRRLSYAQADRVVTALAARLRHMGLPTDAVVGIQLPNIVENVVAILGVLRAGMIAAPLPLLWRRADAVPALSRIGAKALIACGRVGTFRACQSAMRIAAEVFSIRYVCGFGVDLPDGVVPFDDLFTVEEPDPSLMPGRERRSNSAAHVAAITFDVDEGGLVPVARNHPELLAGGLSVLLESRLPEGLSILSTLIPSSFAGISMSLLLWLLSGNTLVLHHPFDADVLGRQQRDDQCGTLVVPGPVAFRLAEAGVFTRSGSSCVIAAWRSPDLLAAGPFWRKTEAALVDVAVFGETALLPARRGTDGRPSTIPFGPLAVPRGDAEAVAVAELTRTEAGTVALRGPMVPRHPFPPGVERSNLPYLKTGRDGLVDSGYACRADSVDGAMMITQPPRGIVGVGGYRFPLQHLQEVARRIDSEAKLAVLPDALIGQRLIGNVVDRETMQAALAAVGVNPIIVAAFQDRSERSAWEPTTGG